MQKRVTFSTGIENIILAQLKIEKKKIPEKYKKRNISKEKIFLRKIKT